ncbi:hypothetical protein N0V93_007958 [Gnomoniopsis smithogilvyi]|uniref:Kinesin motor domain-containing protein n=1 Tax=Gnomoniopsis smithogilvyi TaxID=1191159 RepID=A0A9W8YL43_9PEZI|nr:hypothetical protein N0V93_007958 [Gnomoniopsis smithogilvyi]
MSVRVVARIRPLLDNELERDVIVHADTKDGAKKANVVKIPNPKNESEEFSFTFNSVYDQQTTQEELFSAEVSPHIKSLFQGLDVTIFAYGVTGTGKTHTMRGGLKLADRGAIPRLLSNVFRRGKKIAKDTNGETKVDVALSYYEIYNDKVFDLMVAPEKRTPSGLPLREANGKTNVVGLSERSCSDLKDFEALYIEANNNRVTASTKLNAHSSRSHAILKVKVTQTTGDSVLESVASAIDLAGSEDNRRTENNRERLVESAAINKSLFVLSQCVEAISRGDKRIPYRESKMTRILSLGQNNGITVMILNLAPMRSYHLDTLSSLNVSSRAKRIEVREIENEIVFKQAPRAMNLSGTGVHRQPLRPMANSHNVHAGAVAANRDKADKEKDKPVKAFSVFSDKPKTNVARPAMTALSTQPLKSNISKRKSEAAEAPIRPSKLLRPLATSRPQSMQPSVTMSAAQIEQMVERKVQEILASRAAVVSDQKEQEAAPVLPSAPAVISDAVQRRLEALERRVEENDGASGGRSEGMRLLLQARKLKERGDDEGTLRCYQSALTYFPGQAKLLSKIDKLKAKLASSNSASIEHAEKMEHEPVRRSKTTKTHEAFSGDDANDSEYHGSEADADESYVAPIKHKSKPSKQSKTRPTAYLPTPESSFDNRTGPTDPPTPRTQRLLEIFNSRDEHMIKSLHGFGAKKARDMVERLAQYSNSRIESLDELRQVPGFGGKVLERAWEGLAC